MQDLKMKNQILPKCRGWKMQDWKTKDHKQRRNMQDWKMDDQNSSKRSVILVIKTSTTVNRIREPLHDRTSRYLHIAEQLRHLSAVQSLYHSRATFSPYMAKRTGA